MRTIYPIGNINVVVDRDVKRHYPDGSVVVLGSFIEFQATKKNDRELRQTVARLGFDISTGSNQSYTQM